MNNIRKVFQNFSNRYLLVILLLVVLCPVIIVSYSAFVIDTNNYKASEMMIGNLLYSMEIDTESVTSVAVPANSSKEVIIEINNLNAVSNKYKLIYQTLSNVSVTYASDENEPTKGLISTTRKLSIAITNNNNSAVTVNFNIAGGYSQNDVDDIDIPEGYTEVENTYAKYDLGAVAIYIDNVLVDSLNSSRSYFLSSYECYDSNGELLDDVTLEWDDTLKKASIYPVLKATKCKMYLTYSTTITFDRVISYNVPAHEPMNVSIGQPYGTLPYDVEAGYTLIGWYDMPVGGTKITPETIFTIDSPTKLYAHWQQDHYKVIFLSSNATFNGGTTMNNLVVNGDFTNGTTGWVYASESNGGGISAANGILTYNGVSAFNGPFGQTTSVSVPKSHKILVKTLGKFVTNTDWRIGIGIYTGGVGVYTAPRLNSTSNYEYQGFVLEGNDAPIFFGMYIGGVNNATNGVAYIDNYMALDITSIFGAGNEPAYSTFNNLKYLDSVGSMKIVNNVTCDDVITLNMTPQSGYTFDNLVCTDYMNFQYSNGVATLQHVFADTICTINYKK